MASLNINQFPRRILLLVTGLTPQVVTETLYALAVSAEQKFVPTEIHVITTLEGAQRARLTLLDANTGQFHALCGEYDLPSIQFTASNIHVIPDPSGQPLADIRTPEDNLRAADFISHLVQNFCSDDHAALHVSIAGGRKSMGFFVGYALSLFGRFQDALSHVLVSAPFESLPDFFFPPRQGRVLHARDRRPAHTDDAHIMLAEIPFVRLRGGMPSSLLSGNVSFAQTVNGIQSGLTFIHLEIDIARRAICCGGKWLDLPPVLFTFYLWLAKRCLAGMPDGGAIMRVNPSKEFSSLSTAFLSTYADVIGAMSANFETANQSLKDEAADSQFSGKYFEQKVSKINSRIKQSLPLGAHAYLIAAFGERSFKKYGLRLLPEQISMSLRD